MPTEDPTRYTGYLWTGINTTKLEDLNYDDHGISQSLVFRSEHRQLPWAGERHLPAQ
ncbi:MAG: hypothetical protein ACLR5G_11930 [Eubacteriales bacterium]